MDRQLRTHSNQWNLPLEWYWGPGPSSEGSHQQQEPTWQTSDTIDSLWQNSLIHQLTKMNDAVNPANFEPTLPPPTHGPGSRIEQLQLGLESTELIHSRRTHQLLIIDEVDALQPLLETSKQNIDLQTSKWRKWHNWRKSFVNETCLQTKARAGEWQCSNISSNDSIQRISHHKNSTSEIEETQQMQLTQLTDWLIEGKMLACFCEISHRQQEICIAMWPGDA